MTIYHGYTYDPPERQRLRNERLTCWRLAIEMHSAHWWRRFVNAARREHEIDSVNTLAHFILEVIAGTDIDWMLSRDMDDLDVDILPGHLRDIVCIWQGRGGDQDAVLAEIRACLVELLVMPVPPAVRGA